MLDSAALQVAVNPEVGGTITSIRHKPTNLSVLGEVPWANVGAPLPALAARDEQEWLTRYSGGWPLLFPNAGDACTVEGVHLGFHGEASIAPWAAEFEDGALVLTRTFSSIAATMRRTIAAEGEVLSIHEELVYSGREPAVAMWGHHPTFGSDLLAAPFEVTCGARNVAAEAQYDPDSSPIACGAGGAWPFLPAKHGGSIGLSKPRSPWSSVAYLTDFHDPWAAIRRLDDAIAVLVSWDGRRFPCAWLWYELEATQEAPWNGSTRLVGIEPNTTPCALGLAESLSRHAPVLRLDPGMSLDTWIELRAFRPSGSILNGMNDIPSENTTVNVRPS